jgi:hypothetical protein
MATCVEAAGEVRNEQLRTAVPHGRNGDKWRSDESDVHAMDGFCKIDSSVKRSSRSAVIGDVHRLPRNAVWIGHET